MVNKYLKLKKTLDELYFGDGDEDAVLEALNEECYNNMGIIIEALDIAGEQNV